MDDSHESLMLRAGKGNRAACQLLVERHLGRVVTFAHHTLGNRSDAEEAAQDVFLRVWASAPRWRLGSARFGTWLHRVAMNVCLDLQWRLDAESEALGKLLAADRVDEAAVLAKLGQVTAIEQQVK